MTDIVTINEVEVLTETITVNNLGVLTEVTEDTVIVTEDRFEIIEVNLGPRGFKGDTGDTGPQGVKGDQGIQGPVGSVIETTYVHVQDVPLASWSITHSLNRYPSVTVVDSTGTVVEGDTTYTDSNTVVVSFSGGFAGKAFLN